jgi:hypothetical protein
MSSSSNIQKSRSSSSAGADQTKVKESSIEKTHISTNPKLTETLNDLLKFPLMDAIAGRRSRRFCMGAEIPDGVLAFKSKHKAMPLSEIEQLLILSTMGGATGWHFAIMRHKGYAPYLSNYCNSPVGRTSPSAAAFTTSEIFYTDDSGIYFFPTRDFHPPLEIEDGKVDLEEFLALHKGRIQKLSDKRLYIPKQEPHMFGHNSWIANHEGSTLIIPVGDLAQHTLSSMCLLTQTGFPIYDDISKKPIPGIEKFSNIVDVNNSFPITFMEQYCLSMLTTELSSSCYAAVLMLQAMGLGGWMYDGVNRLSVLGASGDPNVPGLGFRFDMDKERWSIPNPTGLPGVFEGYCPPHYKNMREAVEALAKRKFGEGGVYNPNTPGAWSDSPKVRSSAKPYSEEFKECVALQAQYIYDTYGKFPATIPSIFLDMYIQAQHIDLDFYDHYFKPEVAYLTTHKEHIRKWH